MWKEVGTINKNVVDEQVAQQNGGVILIVIEGEMKALLNKRRGCKCSRAVGWR